ncbi:MAG: ribose-phosphate pyrophosphokinase [Pirellulaceae bacterium]|jgi:ribose-phosphate pyrophosphokinase|nr:ribose-phosphate pyrophosphokinase [Pirellulaceae bacterium]
MRELKIFSGQANRALAKAICNFLHLPLGEVTLGKFPDGENFCKIEEDIRGRDIFLIQPTCPPVNDNIFELLIMIDSCKRASAARITTVIPYFGYARQDRKDEGRVPITAKLVANLITRAGADRVLTMDLHSPQIQGFFDVPVDNMYAAPVLYDFVESIDVAPDKRIVVSPDVGSIKRALGYAKRLGSRLAIVDKRRDNATETRQEHLIGGPVEGMVAVMFDDMISTGGSIVGAATKLKALGAAEIYVAATHGVLCGKAIEKLHDSPITTLAVTDTIPLTPDKVSPKIKTLSVAPLLAEAIKRIHHDQSISILFDRAEG